MTIEFHKKFERYKRQMVLHEVGLEGQKELCKARVLIVGCGGLGSATIPLLAAGGVGQLILCDDDNVQLSNLNRQVIYKTDDIGEPKVVKAAEFTRSLNPDVNVKVLNTRLHPKNFEEIFDQVDLVVDCTDRLAVKLFIHDACLTMKKPLIHSAAIGFIGQVLTILPQGKPCLRCFFENQHMTLELNCANAGVLGSTVAVIGGIIAAEVMKYFLDITSNLVGKLQKIDLKNNIFNVYEFEANKTCISCSDNIKVDPYDVNNYESKLYF